MVYGFLHDFSIQGDVFFVGLLNDRRTRYPHGVSQKELTSAARSLRQNRITMQR
jgi:hypothetical protein